MLCPSARSSFSGFRLDSSPSWQKALLDPLTKSSPAFAISQQFVVLHLPMISLPYQITGVQIVGSGLKWTGLPATPDRKTNMNQKLLVSVAFSLFCFAKSLFARQSPFANGEREWEAESHTHNLPGILKDVTVPSQAYWGFYINSQDQSPSWHMRQPSFRCCE